MTSSSSLASSLHMSSYAVTVTNTPAIKNAPLIGLAEGNGYFNNYHLVALILGVPWFVKRILPLFNLGGWKTYWFLVLLLGVPVTIAYWTVVSHYGPRKNQKIQLPGRSVEEYFTVHDPDLKAKYHGKEKIPMQIFHDAFFEGKIDFNGTPLIILYRVCGLNHAFMTCLRRCTRSNGAATRLGKDGLHPRALQIRLLTVRAWSHHAHQEPRWRTSPRSLWQYVRSFSLCSSTYLIRSGQEVMTFMNGMLVAILEVGRITWHVL